MYDTGVHLIEEKSITTVFLFNIIKIQKLFTIALYLYMRQKIISVYTHDF